MSRSTTTIDIAPPTFNVAEPEENEGLTLGALIRNLDDRTVDEDDMAYQVIDYVLDSRPDLIRQYLHPAVKNQIHTARRMIVLEKERAVDSEIRAGVDPSAARKKLNHETFYIASAGFVPWLEATAEQHLERATAQRMRAQSELEDAARHERAARDIQTAGVRCLADLEKKARKAS